MKILITGATGFIGRHLVARFAAAHDLVAVVRRPSQDSIPPDVQRCIVDLEDPIPVDRLPARIDVIVHLAFVEHTFPEGASRAFAVHTTATQQLLDYGRRAGARQFILASSGDVYGGLVGTSRETDPVRPETFYAATKCAAELLVRAYGSLLTPCVLRLYQPYGPGQIGRLIPRMAEDIRHGRGVRLYPQDRPHLSPIFVDDVVRAIGDAMAANLNGVYNLAGDQVVSIRELASMIGRQLGITPLFDERPEPRGDLAGDASALGRALDFRPAVPLAHGLQLTFG